MDAALLLLLGLEVDRFAGEDDAADALTSSLEALEAGGWSLSPYQGPAIQPYLGLRGGHWQVQMLPALALRDGEAASSDGRTAVVRTTQAAIEVGGQWVPGPWFLGLDAGISGGRARIDGETVADGSLLVAFGPTAGMRAPLNPHVDLVGRARWRLQASEDGVAQGLGGAIALELHR